MDFALTILCLASIPENDLMDMIDDKYGKEYGDEVSGEVCIFGYKSKEEVKEECSNPQWFARYDSLKEGVCDITGKEGICRVIKICV